jgi:hypothetical protein
MIGKKLTPAGKKVMKAVENLLYARRNKNIKREESAHKKLEKLCDEYNLPMGRTISECREWLRENSIAAVMNGIV